MFVDELLIQARAGRGGNGVVRWLHEKGKEFGGPVGGDGGRGGNIIARAVRDIGILARYRHNTMFKAEAGSPGETKSRHGKDGGDTIIELPLGAVLTNTRTKEVIELLEDGEEVTLLHGGAGGRGNEHYKSSTNQNPEEWTPGKDGEIADFAIELRLIADVGLVGLPNAGKTSLLNVLTNAKGKVGSYAFTTLEPNLGECYGRIIADIPGLIEGAAEGKGLGDKFLRHIERTKILFHCISLENENLEEVYAVIRDELARYDETLTKKEEWIILTKTDTVPPEILEKAHTHFEGKGHKVYAVSILDEASVKTLRERIGQDLT